MTLRWSCCHFCMLFTSSSSTVANVLRKCSLTSRSNSSGCSYNLTNAGCYAARFAIFQEIIYGFELRALHVFERLRRTRGPIDEHPWATMRLVNLNSFQYLGLGSSKFAICFWIANAACSSEPGPKNTNKDIPGFRFQLVEDYSLRCPNTWYALPPFGDSRTNPCPAASN
jgi:hypothetical protein